MRRRLLRTLRKAQDFITRWPTPSQWWPVIRESFAGAWQRGIKASVDDVLSHSTAWACITLIANDIAKMRVGLTQTDSDGIAKPVTSASFSPVLRKPNHYQTRIQFFKSWLISKLTRGNTYVLKERDDRRIVTGLYVLDPTRVKPLVSPDGQVFYELQQDDLAYDAIEAARDVAGVIAGEPVRVPASEIIHDVYVAPYHPLCGVSPIYACGMAALQSLKIQANSTRLFENGSQPGGVLTAPGPISTETANRLRTHWEENYTGERNIGKIAVLGDGLKFEKMAMTAVDAQLIDQLNFSDEKICSAYHMPRYKVGVGPDPTYNNIEALNQEYYSECLQIHVEEIELLLEEGLDTGKYDVEFNTDDPLRMDTATQMQVVTAGIKGGVYTPNEGRRRFNLSRLTGGDTVYLQDQDHSIEWLARRDAQPIQLPTPPQSPQKAVPSDDVDDVIAGLRKELALVA